MEIFYHSKFARQYKKLPVLIKKLAEQKELLFRKNPFDPRLKVHKLSGALEGYFSLSINNKYRIIFDFADGRTARFYQIGTHEIYE